DKKEKTVGVIVVEVKVSVGAGEAGKLEDIVLCLCYVQGIAVGGWIHLVTGHGECAGDERLQQGYAMARRVSIGGREALVGVENLPEATNVRAPPIVSNPGQAQTAPPVSSGAHHRDVGAWHARA